MKAQIHPNYNSQVTVTCTCGNTFVTGSIRDKIQVDICAACHPFFTGEVKYVDLAGRVDRFMAKQQAAQSLSQTRGKKDPRVAKSNNQQQSLKEMLQSIKKKAPSEPASSTETSS